MRQTGRLVVISGPSGVGKSSIVREALRRTKAQYSVSLTTRPPRPGEVDGRDYRFVDRARFEEILQAGGTAEHAEVHGHLYGTPVGPIREALAAGQTILLDIDVQGAIQVHEKFPDATYILIVPPNPKELERRLRGRGTEDPAAIARRLAAAQKEIDAADGSRVYNHRVINDRLDDAINQVVEIIQTH